MTDKTTLEDRESAHFLALSCVRCDDLLAIPWPSRAVRRNARSWYDIIDDMLLDAGWDTATGQEADGPLLVCPLCPSCTAAMGDDDDEGKEE